MNIKQTFVCRYLNISYNSFFYFYFRFLVCKLADLPKMDFFFLDSLIFVWELNELFAFEIKVLKKSSIKNQNLFSAF